MDCEQPLQSKTILNSRVLGYGQLNGHVASIVSMFSKEKVLKRKCVGETLEGETYTCEVLMMESWKLFYNKFCKENYSFLSNLFFKEKYSFLKSIFTKTSLINDIHERNYIIYEILFLVEI